MRVLRYTSFVGSVAVVGVVVVVVVEIMFSLRFVVGS